MTKPLHLRLLPGWSMPKSVFANLIAALKEAGAEDVFASIEALSLPVYELAGGESRAELWDDSETLCAELAAQLPNEDTLLLGWSLGGNLATLLAAQNPQLKALVLVASNPCFVSPSDEKADAWPGMAAETFTSFSANVESKSAKTLRQFQQLVTQGSLQARQHVRFFREAGVVADEPTLNASLKWLNRDYRVDLAELKLPVLHLLAADDALVPSYCAQSIASRYPSHSLVLIAKSSHLLICDQSPEVAQSIVKFAKGRVGAGQ